MLNYGIVTWLWLAAVVVFVVIEALTAEMVSIWFVAGSLAAFLLSLFKLNIAIQIAAFVVVSAAALALLRPIAKKRLEPKKVPTNADRVIGAVATVIRAVEPDSVGRVMVDGQDWSAVSSDSFSPGDKVVVTAIDGVKLVVKAR